MKLKKISNYKQQLEIKQHLVRFLGLVFITLGILGLFLKTQYQIVCQQKSYSLAKECVLKSTIYNFYQNITVLGQLEAARVQSGTSSKGGTLYAVYLDTDHGFINLTGSKSSGRSEKEAAANAINSYINSSLEKSFIIPYPPNLFFTVVNIIFFIAGVLLLSIKDAIILFDKATASVTIQRRRLWGRAEEIRFSLASVDRVIIEKSAGSKGTYRLALAFKDKPAFPFVSFYDSVYWKKEKIANQINEFIHQQPEDSPTITGYR
ncbi:hypothetical protein OQJ15_15630 [Fluoribacter dumoffii]|uniref:hypothetical protein n=1 Tax=Fluoribacter dumoffii TaxID=463 RepID=UPI002243D658|nr:hypothetical protein [Fluoribacter dumoffii]MCW8387740.1 hypothetical protein [Fluoribacter dumoffii]MCW8497943.1 hypothetical protein [Fluoribacter dumoffii]